MHRCVTGILLLGYVASYFTTGLFVLCVHRDGRAFLEPVSDLCCENRSGAKECDPDPSDSFLPNDGSQISGDSCPECDDYTIPHLGVCQSTQSQEAGSSLDESPLPIPYLAFWTYDPIKEGIHSSLTGSHPLPRGSPPICRAIVLRI